MLKLQMNGGLVCSAGVEFARLGTCECDETPRLLRDPLRPTSVSKFRGHVMPDPGPCLISYSIVILLH